MDKLEKFLLFLLGVTTLVGLYWGFADPDFFTYRFMMEDGEIEYGTVVLLLASSFLVVFRWIKLRKQRPVHFTLISLLIFLMFFFVAGEELSWGQRIFSIESSEYFKEHNAQEELNLHNLTVGDVKINKLVFGLILTTVVMVYLIVVPILYSRVDYMKNLIDRWYVPVPRLRHIVSYLLLILAISIIPASKNWELHEFGSALVFFLILWNPVNKKLYSTGTSEGDDP